MRTTRYREFESVLVQPGVRLFALESRYVFLNHWQVVGHENDIPAPGDWLSFDLLGERAVVMRGQDGAVRAFHNLCRHRGARVVDGAAGHCRGSIVCPFHGWVYNLDGSVLWSNTIQEFSSSRTGSSVFDFDGDGSAEVVYNDENTLWVFSYVGTSSAAVVWSTPNSTLTAHEYPVIADVDNDGNAEIIVGSNDFARGTGLQRGLRVYGDVADNWVPTRTIWNQHAYHITNITNAGAVPYPETPSWTNTNTYRTNLQGTGTGGALAAPDFVADAPRSVKMCAAYIDLGVWVENRGAILVGPGVSVAFYDGAPSAQNAAFATSATSRLLRPGEAEFVAVRWPSPPASPRSVHILVDDDGSGLGRGGQNECNEGTGNSVIVPGLGCP